MIITAKSLSRERSNLQSPTFGRSLPSGRECSKSRATRVLAAGGSATETDHIATRHATLSLFRDFYTISRSPNARIEMASFSSITVAFSFNHCFQNTNFIKFSFFTSFKIKRCRCAVFILKMLYVTMLELYPNN